MIILTSKRFTTEYTNHYVLEVDVYDNGERMSFYETIDLLNELHEENEKLTQRNQQLKERLDRKIASEMG